MDKDPSCDLFASVDRSSIPEKDDGTWDLSEQVCEEVADVQPGEVACRIADIEGHVPSLWRNCQRTDGRDSILFVEIVEQGSFPPRCPGAGDIGNE